MFNINAVNNDLKTKGSWGEFNGARFLIAYARNTKYIAEMKALSKPYINDIKKDKLDPEVAHELYCKALAKTILLDWENIADGDKPLAYSVDVGVSALSLNDDVREFVVAFSEDLSNYRDEEVKATVKK